MSEWKFDFFEGKRLFHAATPTPVSATEKRLPWQHEGNEGSLGTTAPVWYCWYFSENYSWKPQKRKHELIENYILPNENNKKDAYYVIKARWYFQEVLKEISSMRWGKVLSDWEWNSLPELLLKINCSIRTFSKLSNTLKVQQFLRLHRNNCHSLIF